MRCTREGITINTFMLARGHYLVDFVNQMSKINHGRAFYVEPERLGEDGLTHSLDNKPQRPCHTAQQPGRDGRQRGRGQVPA